MSHLLPSAPIIPLTPLQQGMYFTWLQDPAAGIDIEQMVCTLPEAIDAPRLRAAWETLTATHEILRTTFTAEAATIRPTLPTPWQELDLSPSTFDVQRSTLNVSTSPAFPDSPPDSLSAFLEKDRTTPFDLPTGPLQRLTLLRHSPEDYRLIWTFHHILIDGRAITALLREVFTLYDQAPSVPTPAPTTGALSNLKYQILPQPPPSSPTTTGKPPSTTPPPPLSGKPTSPASTAPPL